MLKHFIKWGYRQSFQPNLFSIFVNPFFLIRRSLYLSIVENAVHLKGKMLDLGCGRKPYKNIFSSITDYIGVDIEQSGHPHSLSQIDVYYDGKTLPFEDNYFDSVFCSEVVEHIFNLDEVLAEINRVMRQGGIGLFTFPFAWIEHEQPYDFARYTSFASKQIFEKHGFVILNQSKTGSFIAVIFQYIILYIHPDKLNTKLFYYLLYFSSLIFIVPLTILGIIFSTLLPNKQDLYFNNVLLVQKK